MTPATDAQPRPWRPPHVCSTTPFEIDRVARIIAGHAERDVYLEIGSFLGGSLWHFGRSMATGAKLIAVDRPMAKHREGRELKAVSAHLRAEGYEPYVVLGDSHAPVTQKRVRQILDGRPVDVLVLDGDHTIAGVAADLADYETLVQPNGLVLFHDSGLCLGTAKLNELAYQRVQGIHAVMRDYAHGRHFILVQQRCGYAVVWKGE